MDSLVIHHFFLISFSVDVGVDSKRSYSNVLAIERMWTFSEAVMNQLDILERYSPFGKCMDRKETVLAGANSVDRCLGTRSWRETMINTALVYLSGQSFHCIDTQLAYVGIRHT